METQQGCTQQMIVSYLHGTLEKQDEEQIKNLRKENPATELLFELIEKLKKQVTIKEKADDISYLALNYSAFEELLMRIFSGKCKRNEAQQFIDALMFSPVFYQRMLVKLESVGAVIAAAEVPQMAQVQVQSNEELLYRIHAAAARNNAASERGGIAVPAPGIKSRLADFFNRIPRFAYAIPVVALLVAIVLINAPFLRRDFALTYVYDEQVPYEYEASSLRGAQDLFEGEPQIQTFVNQFRLGISDYLVRNYEGAIQTLGSLESSANSLQLNSKSKESLQYIRDFYFYLGLSHFALARSQSRDLEQDVKTQHIIAAINYLKRAEALIQSHDLAGKDRETYFLGLAYGFGGQKEAALAQLQKINPQSVFYQNSVELIQQWSK